MSEIHKFIFQGLPVRGVLVRLSDSWSEILRRRAGSTTQTDYPQPVKQLLGEMTAAAVLMQSSIKFNGSLILQIFGDGPVKLAVVEVKSDFGFRATATVNGLVQPDDGLIQMLNVSNDGRCAVTLDPQDRLPGQQAYQGVVPLFGDGHKKFEQFSEVMQHYMLQSEQLETTLVLASDDKVAAGLMIQRLSTQGAGNLDGQTAPDELELNEHYARIAILASSLKREELLTLDVETILRRLFWDEKLVRFEPLAGKSGPRFCCTCSREKVGRMLVSLGVQEAQSVLKERGEVEVECDFCGVQYRFDAIDVGLLFRQPDQLPAVSAVVQ